MERVIVDGFSEGAMAILKAAFRQYIVDNKDEVRKLLEPVETNEPGDWRSIMKRTYEVVTAAVKRAKTLSGIKVTPCSNREIASCVVKYVFTHLDAWIHPHEKRVPGMRAFLDNFDECTFDWRSIKLKEGSKKAVYYKKLLPFFGKSNGIMPCQ